MTIPFLTEDEWAEVHPLLVLDHERIKSHRLEAGVSLQDAIASLSESACQRYFEITGFTENNPNALWHHHLGLYGRECPACQHLFRTPKASFCAHCGWQVGHIHIDWDVVSDSEDFYTRVLRQMDAPSWHGHNLAALNDSWVTGSICQGGPPFEFRFTSAPGSSRLPEGFAAVVLDIARDSVTAHGGSISIREGAVQ